MSCKSSPIKLNKRDAKQKRNKILILNTRAESLRPTSHVSSKKPLKRDATVGRSPVTVPMLERRFRMPIPIKILVLGSNACGKTSFINRLLFTPVQDSLKRFSLDQTINFRSSGATSHHVNIGDKNYNLVDCAGQEFYMHDWNELCKNVDVAVIMFDITNSLSVKSVENYIAMLKRNMFMTCGRTENQCGQKIIIIGNKRDALESKLTKRATKNWSPEEILTETNNISNEYDRISNIRLELRALGYKYIEISVKTGYNVNRVFSQLN